MELKEDFKAMGYGKELSTVNDVVYCRNVSFSKRFFFLKTTQKLSLIFCSASTAETWSVI
jgi:hypothetical protein